MSERPMPQSRVLFVDRSRARGALALKQVVADEAQRATGLASLEGDAVLLRCALAAAYDACRRGSRARGAYGPSKPSRPTPRAPDDFGLTRAAAAAHERARDAEKCHARRRRVKGAGGRLGRRAGGVGPARLHARRVAEEQSRRRAICGETSTRRSNFTATRSRRRRRRTRPL